VDPVGLVAHQALECRVAIARLQIGLAILERPHLLQRNRDIPARQVLASDLYSNFSNIDNTQDPGFLVSFMTPEKYGSVVFTTGSSDFEFAAVPEPSTWAMLGLGFAGLALAGYKRSRPDRLAPALG